MLGNGFDLYHNLLTHYDDFMTIAEYLSKKYNTIFYEEFNEINIYSELDDLSKTNKVIREKLLTYEDVYKETKINIDEYVRFLDKLHLNCWFKYFIDIKNRNGWVALENQVAEVLREFRQSNPRGIDRFLDAIKEKYNFNDAFFKHIKNYSFAGEEYDNYIFEEYNDFIEILKLYLKIFVDNVLPQISNHYVFNNNYLKNNDYVLTFNYTNTYDELYDTESYIIHIHGRLDEAIVLGVNSDEYDNAGINDNRFIKYKKYYQRITKRTLDALVTLFTDVNSTTEQNSLFIIGHSLDVSDKDIITVIFDMFDVIKIYFHDDSALDSYVKNLKLIFGAEKLSKMTFSQKIIFRKLPPNQYKKVNTNDQL